VSASLNFGWLVATVQRSAVAEATRPTVFLPNRRRLRSALPSHTAGALRLREALALLRTALPVLGFLVQVAI